jgi:hypothetical protein
MKTLTHTIITFIALNLSAAGFAPAQNVSGEGLSDSFEIQAAEAEVAAVLAQTRTRQPEVPVIPSESSTAPPIPTPSIPTPSMPAPAPPPTEPVSVELVANDVANLVQSFSLGSRSDSTGTVLVIPSEQTNTEDLLSINEDMSVMSRIFEKNIQQALIGTARGNPYTSRQDPLSTLLGGGRGGIQSIYLQGYAALFLMKVDFPLTPPPGLQDDEKEIQKTEGGDPVWQQMKQEMYEPQRANRRRRTDRPEEKYDAEKVENFKTILIKALKHAANIRSLKPDESVILTVTGKGQATGTTIIKAMRSGENQILVQERTADGKMINKVISGTSLDDIGLSSPSVLVIRTKKSDIDEFAKGNLGFDQFRQRVKLLTYPLLGGADHGHRNPFDAYYGGSRSAGSYGARSTGSSNRR